MLQIYNAVNRQEKIILTIMVLSAGNQFFLKVKFIFIISAGNNKKLFWPKKVSLVIAFSH
jgi:hypothetical protein